MRTTTAFLAALGILATGISPAFADQMPNNMQAAPAPKPAAGASDQAHRQGMEHGGQQMHDRMMHDHQMGMQNKQQPAMNGMAPQSGQPAMPMKKKGCCKGKPMKPADKPMPMKHM